MACAVDVCLESIRRAVEWKADVLFVHHGLFWGKPVAFTGFQYRRIRELVSGDCALYAVHLPLDAHSTLGNNAGIARRLGLREVQPFGEHRGVKIGCRGELPEALSLERVASLCCGAHAPLGLLPFGPQAIRTVGIVSGGAPQDALQAIEEGLDLFISGEPSHTVYHACLEAGINALFGGHYLTEVWGVKSVGEWLAARARPGDLFPGHSDRIVGRYLLRDVKAKLLPLLLTVGVIAADQVVKWIVTRTLPYGRPVEVIGDFLRLVYVQNPNIGFSIGRSLGGGGRFVLARLLPLIVSGILLVYYLVGKDITRFQRWVLAAVLGGGLGNYVDRIFRQGEVVDFIDVKFYGILGMQRWPTFNLADSTLVVGGILLLASFLFTREKKSA